MKEKLIIISMRLPLSVSRVDGELKFSQSVGGLATGIGSLKLSADSVWVGWPGIASDDLSAADRRQITTECEKAGCYPVFLTQLQVDNFYTGYSNSTLWPLLHDFTDKAVHKGPYWEAFCEVNDVFVKVAQTFYDSRSQYWVHDYQLMLAPRLLREADRGAVIGFFLHTPFPGYDTLSQLPQDQEILSGILGADLVGLQTTSDTESFLGNISQSLGVGSDGRVVRYEGRTVVVDDFPIGIDYDKYATNVISSSVKEIQQNSYLACSPCQVALSIDRADYTKGIPERLDAIELFLKRHTGYRQKVVFVMIAVPSRGEVEAYRELRTSIEQRVSRINGEYATTDWTPIIYRHQSLPFDELCSLYAMADVMLVTPLRDGMNLVAKEYVASRTRGDGVLVLSSRAGAAAELTVAMQIDPTDTSQFADAIYLSLSMPLAMQKKRMKALQLIVSSQTIQVWAGSFLTELAEATKTKQTA